jgi:hypothetical protein
MWLEEEGLDANPGQPAQNMQQQPVPTMPNAQQASMSDPNQQKIPQANPGDQKSMSDNDKAPDQGQLDPNSPDMPEENDEVEFNSWKNEYFKLAVQGDTDKMLDSIDTIRNHDLKASQTKFVEDNFQILLLRQDANFDKVSKSIRRSIKTDVDKDHPGVSMMQIISQELDPNPVLSEILVKLFGFHGLKGELHRKFLAALTGSVQVGGGASKEDIVFNDKDFSINISTRMASDFGEINLGKWSLQDDDTHKFLAEPEVARLQEGSPEERKALIHRVVMSSIAEKFKKRAFLIHVVSETGNVYSIGWDLGDSLQSAYKEGKLIVKSDDSDDADVSINEAGELVPLKNLGIYAKMPDSEIGDNGETEEKTVPFIENRSGTLYFVADMDTMNSMGGNLAGMSFQNKPYTGSPVEFKNLTRCIPSMTELLLRRC